MSLSDPLNTNSKVQANSGELLREPMSPTMKNEKYTHHRNEPADEGNIVYYCFLFYGITILLPWTAILNSFDYF